MYRPTRAVIDFNAIRSNFRNLRALAGDGFFCPMVKANAYGHGATEVVGAIAQDGCQRVGVVMVEEGLHLRKAGVTAMEILVFSRLTPESATAVIEQRLTPVLSTRRDLEILESLARQPVAVHLKFNTGMNRMGFAPEDAGALNEFFARSRVLKCVGLCTHLSHGEDAGTGNGRSARQVELFQTLLGQFHQPRTARHVLNSSGLLGYAAKMPEVAAQLGARPGLALYGLVDSPIVQPCMRLLTGLDLVRRVKKNESVSYGGRWTASKDSWVGIVPIGYGDGYFRSLSNKAHMLFRGHRVPVVGTICMDYSLLDLTDACNGDEPRLGEEIVVFGQQGSVSISVLELTRLVDTIPYELVTCLSARVPREYR